MDFIFSLPVGLLLIVPLWRIFQRAGLAAPLALFVFVPLLGPFIVAAILAFSRWPNTDGPDAVRVVRWN